MNIKYKINYGFKADAITDTSDDRMSVLAPSSQLIIIINLIIKFVPAYQT